MKIGDLVRPIYDPCKTASGDFWVGIIVDFHGADPIIFWDSDFPEEYEYEHQLRVISEVSDKNNSTNLKQGENNG